jgi:hypothetical protein
MKDFCIDCTFAKNHTDTSSPLEEIDMADDSYQLGYRSDQDGISSVNFEIPEERDLGSSRFWLLANRHMLVFLKHTKDQRQQVDWKGCT